jgi:4-hydroxy-tetrahydrodipicolinate synthase
MAEQHIFQGLSVALVTPFNEDFSIDREAYVRHLNYMIDGGVDGLVVCGTTGESPTFSDEEFEYLVGMAVEVSNGRSRVIAGSGSNATNKSIKRSKMAEKLGADGLLIVAPYYNKPVQEGLYGHYIAIADAVDVPLIVYNVPGRTAVNILPETIVRMAQHPNIVAVKEASGNMQQIEQVIASVPDDFTVLSGDDAMTLPLIAAGGKGIVSVAGNEVPSRMKAYTDACLSDDMKKARTLHYELQPLMLANFWQSNPIPVKAALSMMGHMENILRLPLVPLDKKFEPGLRDILDELGVL